MVATSQFMTVAEFMLAQISKLAFGACLALLSAFVVDPSLSASGASPFQMTASRGAGGSLELSWTIPAGDYLYRDKMQASDESGRSIRVSTPPGEVKDDPTFGPTEVYHGRVTATIPASELADRTAVRVGYQGCAERGICYPPQITGVDLKSLVGPNASGLPGAGLPGAEKPRSESTGGALSGAGVQGGSPAPRAPTSDWPASFLSGAMPTLLGAFLGFGVLLAFTPCVLPLLPILVGVLAGSGKKLSAGRGFLLSACYALGMALAYAALGAAAAWSGRNLQAVLQTPLALGSMAVVLATLALSSFGLFELKVPARWSTILTPRQERPFGQAWGAAVLGFTSALIVGPCVTPPLAAALLYVAETGDLARGAAALFALGLGMGLPVIAVGTLGSRILPKSGPWLLQVRALFGIMFLSLAIEMLGRIVSPTATMGLWGLLAIGAGVFAGGVERLGWDSGPSSRLAKAAGLAAIVYGTTLIVGFAAGSDDPLRPLAFLARDSAGPLVASLPVRTVSSLGGLEQAIDDARHEQRPMLVEFSADWCATCKTIEAQLAGDSAIRNRLEQISVIRVDLTRETADSRELMKRYAVAGPPTLLFLRSQDGEEVPGSRSVGDVSVEELRRKLRFSQADPT